MDDDTDLALAAVQDVHEDILQTFDCNDEELNKFLKQEAKEYCKHGLTRTTVVFLDGKVDRVVAYFSLSADSIALNITELSELGLPFETKVTFFPAVKITKLAVHKDFQSQGIGARLIDLIQGMAYDTAPAVRLLNVNALNNERTLSFYERVGFIENLDAKDRRENRKRGGLGSQSDTVLMHRDIYS